MYGCPPPCTVEQHYFNSAHPRVAQLIYEVEIYFIGVQTYKNREQLLGPPVPIQSSECGDFAIEQDTGGWLCALYQTKSKMH